MREDQNYDRTYSNILAKVCLYGAGVDEVIDGPNSQMDLIIPANGLNKSKVMVDVLPSKKSIEEIQSEYEDLRKTHSNRTGSTMLMYINYEDRTGYFQLIQDGKTGDIRSLSTEDLREELSQA